MDKLIHGLCAEDSVRVFAVTAPQMIKDLQMLHDLSRVATAALGRQTMMTALMASDLKNEDDKVTTIIKADGPCRNMICTGKPGPTVKAYTAGPKEELLPRADGKLDVAGYVGQGQLTVIRDLPVGDPYVGVCDLVSGEIAMDFAQYYTVSEQQPSLVYLGVRVDAISGEVRAAAGLMAQPLPNCPDEVLDALQQRAPEIAQLTLRLDRGEAFDDIIEQIFDGLGFKTVKTFEPKLRCDCSRERIEKALITIGKEELTDMIERDGGAEVTCQFCNTAYRFNADELNRLLYLATEETIER